MVKDTVFHEDGKTPRYILENKGDVTSASCFASDGTLIGRRVLDWANMKFLETTGMFKESDKIAKFFEEMFKFLE